MVRARSRWTSASSDGAAPPVVSRPIRSSCSASSAPRRSGSALPDVVLIEPAELVVVEGGGRTIHVGDVERRNHLVTREDLLIAVRPAQPRELVEQRLRQISVVAELHHPDRAVTLRQPLAVRAEDHRHMSVARRRRIQRRDDVQLPGGVHHVVVAANDVGDVHVQVIDDDAEVVRRHAVPARNDEIVELAVVERDRAPYQIIEDDGTVVRIPEPNDGIDPGRRRSGPVPAPPVVAGLLGARALCRAHRLELFLAAVAAVRPALAQQSLDVAPGTAPAGRSGTRDLRRLRARAIGVRPRSRRSMPASNARDRCPRSGARMCPRGGVRRASRTGRYVHRRRAGVPWDSARIWSECS